VLAQLRTNFPTPNPLPAAVFYLVAVMALVTSHAVTDPLWQHFGLAKLFRGTNEVARVLPSMREIGTYPSQNLWRSVQQDQSLMTALTRRCEADKVALSSAFHVDHTQFLDMQKQVLTRTSRQNIGAYVGADAFGSSGLTPLATARPAYMLRERL